LFHLFHETGETIGTVGTLFTPKITLKSIKKGVITSIKQAKKCVFSMFSTQKILKNTHFHRKTLKKASFLTKKSLIFNQMRLFCFSLKAIPN